MKKSNEPTSNRKLNQVKEDLENLLNKKRIELIPWHVSNVGPELSALKNWEITAALELLDPQPDDSVLVVEDSLGIYSYLLQPHCHVTCNQSQPRPYEFERPVEFWVASLPDLPPKHPRQDTTYDKVLFLSLYENLSRCERYLHCLRGLLSPGGQLIVSFFMSLIDTIQPVGSRALTQSALSALLVTQGLTTQDSASHLSFDGARLTVAALSRSK